jgi:hypothetical protein
MVARPCTLEISARIPRRSLTTLKNKVQIHVLHKQTQRNVSDSPVSTIREYLLIVVVGMLQVIGAAPGAVAICDYAQAWRESSEFQAVKAELQHMRENPKPLMNDTSDKHAHDEYAATFLVQLYYVTYRFFQQLYRTPSYIVSDISGMSGEVLPDFVLHRVYTVQQVFFGRRKQPFYRLRILQGP